MSKKRHIYEYDVDPESNTAPANVIRMVGPNKRVLEVGCGPGSITRILAQKNQCRVTGLEIDPDAIDRVEPFCERVIQSDLNSKEWVHSIDGLERFDVVVAADVLEHLYDPWSVLKQMVPLINKTGYFVISIPHIGHAAIMACLINGDFEYRDWGLLDRTHIRFFGLKNMESLFAQAGLKIIEAGYVTKPAEESEFAATWSKLSDRVKTALRACAHADVYQVVVKAVPVDNPGAAVSLVPPGNSKQIAGNAYSLRKMIGSILSPQAKMFIRKGLSAFGIKV